MDQWDGIPNPLFFYTLMIEVTTVCPEVNIISIKINDWERKKKKLLEIMDRATIIQAENHQSSFKNSHADSDRFEEVGEILNEEFEAFSQHVKHRDFQMSIWFQSYGAMEYHGIHNHVPGCHYASIIYLCHDPAFHHPTQFIYRDPFNGYLEPWSNKSSGEGYWYLWPAAMEHYTLPHSHPDAPTRKIMSMNLEFVNV